MEYTKQSGVDHKVQRLYVHWDVTTVCEYKCSYCYAMQEYKESWMRPGPWQKQLRVIDELSKSSLPIFLGILGGEPTSHHKYFELLDLIKTKVLTHKDSRLYITTNGDKSIEFYEKHEPVNGNVYILWSYHPEYVDTDGTGKEAVAFIMKVKAMKKLGYRTKINVMLHPKKEHWGKTFLIINALNALNEVEVHPHFIYSSPHSTVKYSEEFYNFFEDLINSQSKEFIFEDENIASYFTDIEIFRNKMNQFQGWNCWNNNYEINLDCQVNQFCFGEKMQIPNDYFKNIKEISPKICPHKFCSCDGLLKIKKEKL